MRFKLVDVCVVRVDKLHICLFHNEGKYTNNFNSFHYTCNVKVIVYDVTERCKTAVFRLMKNSKERKIKVKTNSAIKLYTFAQVLIDTFY